MADAPMTTEKRAVPAKGRRAYRPDELPSHLVAAIRDAKMAPEHDHLNALMEDDDAE